MFIKLLHLIVYKSFINELKFKNNYPTFFFFLTAFLFFFKEKKLSYDNKI